MKWPFCVFALPRSRTAWLQYWLGGSKLVGHDLAIGEDSVRSWLDCLWHGRTGTVETGTPELGLLVPVAMPGAKIVTIRRPLDDVVRSLHGIGIGQDGLVDELQRRERVLDQLELRGAERVGFADLADPSCCAWLFEHLTGLRFDFDWWQVASSRNVQVDVEATLAKQQACLKEMIKLQVDCENRLALSELQRFIRVGLEPWDSFWVDGESRFAGDSLDTWGEFPGRPHKVNAAALAGEAAARRLIVVTARRNGKLVGYCLWHLGEALQSVGTKLARQGPLYAEPGHFAVAKRLLDFSLSVLPRLGFHSVELQHNEAGRSARLGREFSRRGARPMKRIWALELD